MEKPHIPSPCSADYNKMSPTHNGRFCETCCKVVIDFTKKSAQDILDYLRKHSGEKICGRVRPSQLETIPVTNGQKLTGRFKRFYLALYVAFGGLLFASSCTAGEVMEKHKSDSTYMADSMAKVMSMQKSDSLTDSTANHH